MAGVSGTPASDRKRQGEAALEQAKSSSDQASQHAGRKEFEAGDACLGGKQRLRRGRCGKSPNLLAGALWLKGW
jgi:hypothetical protein